MSQELSAFGGIVRLRSAFIFLGWALAGLVASPAMAQPTASPGFGSQTRAQIDAIQEEKAARSGAFRKLDSQLIYALRRERFGNAVAAASSLRANVRSEPDGRIAVDINAEVRPELLLFINQQGGQVLSQYPRYRAIRAVVPLGSVELLASHPSVRSIQPAVPAFTRAGAVVSEGDVAHQASLARDNFLISGAGVKVGVLSDGVTYYDGSQSKGELPAITILPGEAGSGLGEGTAMMEIVHDLAPNSELYFATAFQGVASFADNIRRLYAAGCRIMVDDVIYFNESPFQDGPIAEAVNEVSAGGALFFSSAGNEGNLNDNTSGTWEGDFNDGGPVSIGRGGRVHSFGGAQYNTILPGGGFRRLDLFWADPLGQSTNDYDLYVLDANGDVVSSSTNIQDGQQDPWEWIGTVNEGQRVVIVKYAGAARYLHLSAFRGRLTFGTAGSSRGHNASGAPNAFCVAATEAAKPPVAFAGGATNPVESFSSDGPRRMFFYPNGQPITPGNFSATGGVALQKPDLTAADGVATSVPGFEHFYGTSAAAPHAAAIAALIWSYNSALTPGQIRSALTAGVLDIESNGRDRDSGEGIPMVPQVLNLAPAPAPGLLMEGVQIGDADGSGSLDVNECAEVRVVLRNIIGTNGSAASGVTAVLTTATPGVLVEPIAKAFPEVPPGGLATNVFPFRISSDSAYVCWQGAILELQVSSANAGSYLFPITIAAMTNGVGSATQYEATDLPLPIPDSGTLESTVSVQNFDLPLGEATVSLHVQHPYDSDLHITLVAPDSTEVVLCANRGGSGDNFGISCESRTVFSDRASNTIASGTAPFVGVFIPDAPLSVLWGRTGSDVNGTWRLRVADGVEADAGNLICWTLSLSPRIGRDLGNPCLVPATIVQAPSGQVATNGDTVAFTATAHGTDPLNYTWWFNETNLLTSVFGTTLVLSNVAAVQEGSYSVVASNFYGAATSAPARLDILVRPFLTMAPSDLVATNGDTVSFAVAAGGTAPLSYQWFFQGTNALPDGTSSALILTNIDLTKAGPYAVRISNGVGTSLSPDANLTVLEGPAISVGPVDVVATNGDLVRLEVAASGSAPLGYQWWHDETNLVTGASGPVLDLTGITPAQAGTYAVVVSNMIGTTRSGNALVTVLVPPHIELQPQNFAVSQAQNAELIVGATGNPLPTYQWYFNATNLLGQANAFINFTNVLAGATNALLVLSNVSPAQAGEYAVVVSNFIGSVTSAPAQLTVLVGPAITVEPLDLVATNGDLVRLEVSASGSAPLGYQWWHDETNQVTGASGPVLELAGITAAQAGTYAVVVSNTVGSVRSRAAQVTVLSGPAILSGPASQVATNGDPVSLEVLASGSAPLAYQWWYQSTNALAEATNALLVLSNVSPAQAGEYAVVVSNFIGSVTSAPAQLTVLVGPAITVEPLDVVATNGELVRLEVAANGSAPLGYQWWHDETNQVTGASGPVLELAGITAAQVGTYAVVVSNPVGSVRSRAAQVTVLSGPAIVSGPASQVATNGDPVTLEVVANGSTPLAYQWWYQSTNALAEGTNALLVLSNVSPAQAGEYAVVVSNFIGSVTSAPAQLTVLVGPAITVEPLDVVATNGELVRLEVAANGSAPLGYQWWHDETNLVSGATGPVLELTGITAAQAGMYAVVVSNTVGSVRSRAAQVTVLSGPAIVSGPASQVATNGDPVSLEVVASGSAPLAYQWWYQSTNALAEATNALLVLSNVSPADAGEYAVVVSNFIGSVTSAPAQLTVLVGPAITVEPLDVVATNGELVRLEVSATGSAPLGYQWWHDETNQVTGASGPVLELAGITAAQAGMYAVVVSNTVGSVRSRAAQVTVLSGPAIVSGPASQVATNGDPVSLEVVASGSTPLAYQWWYQSTNALAEGTNALLVLSNVSPAQAGEYAVVVSNFIGSVTSAPAQLTVLVGPAIAAEPLDVVATNGDLVRLEVSASGSAPLGYQWWHDETNLVSGATGPVLELTGITAAQAGMYAVVVSNTVGSVRSRAAQVTVLSGPAIVSGPASQVATNGDPVSLEVVASGSTPLAYQWWYQSTNALAEGTNALLVLSNVSPAQAGEYAVVVSNFIGSVTSAPAQLTVLVGPAITVEPLDVVATNGELVRLEVSATGSAPLGYQWWHDETNQVTGASGPVLELAGITAAQAGTYAVVVSNPVGSVRSRAAQVTVLSGPAIVSGPASQVATNGDPVSLEVVASGSAPLAYQWWYQSTNALAEATNALLVLSNVSPAQAGEYAVVVSNFIGSVTSAPAQLTVLVGPAITVEPLDLVATNGELVRLEVSASGSAPLGYQWWHDETNRVSGASGPVLELPGITAAQAGTYAVVVSNTVGSVRSRAAQVTVLSGPAILSGPASQVATNGDPVSLEVLASGSTPLAYQWWYQSTNALAEATNALLVLSNVSPAQAGEYAVVVSNFIGSVTSAPAQLTVLVGPAITVEPLDLVATNGELVRLEVSASGSAPLGYQWWHDETNRVSGASGPVLELPGITAAQAGTYAVVVSNTVGSVRSRAAQVTVFSLPQIHTQPQNLAVPRGQIAEFTIGATGFPVPNYQWFFNATNLLQLQTNLVLTRTNVQAVDAGQYHVQVSNALGVATSSFAVLSVGDPPVIVAQPQNLTVRSGQAVGFSVQATGSLPLDYLWYFKGTNFVSSGAALMLTNVVAAQSGPYHAVATNAFGASASLAGVLRVLEPVTITAYTRTGSAFNLSFSTVVGFRYTVEYSTNLSPTGWLRVSGASKLVAVGESMTIQDSAATNAYRFYRVLVE